MSAPANNGVASSSPPVAVAAGGAPAPGSHLAEPEAPAVAVWALTKDLAFKSIAWIGIYLLGYYDFSVAWLVTPLLLSVLRTQWRKERDAKLSAARQAALTSEKVMIESRIRAEDLPSWVFFPDKERAEWINSIVQQLWPNVGHYTRKLISESVEPAVKKALEGFGFNGFKFERVVLGQIPPRITGIKVYDKNVSRQEIIMDMDLVFASDCDIKFSIGKIKAKIMDFSLRGLLRVVFKPIVSDMPLIGGVQVYFLTPPDIDFDLGGIANAFDAPGLSSLIRRIVLEQIGYFMVLPHKYTMPLIESVENRVLKCPDSAGVLRVRLHRAIQLVKKDVGILGMGKSDPYAILTVGARTVRTKRINNTVNPEWNFVADFPIEVVKGQQLTLEIMDHDDPGEDEFLGRATVQTSVVAAKGEIRDMWVELEDIASGRALLTLSWMEASANKQDLEKTVAKGDEMLARCLLHVFVDSCKGLDTLKGSGKKPSPMVDLRIGHSDAQSTFPQFYTTDPVFEQGFVFLVTSPDADDLIIKVVDTGHADTVLGEAKLRLSDIIQRPSMEMKNQPILLKGTQGGTIVMSAQVRALREPRKISSFKKQDSKAKSDSTAQSDSAQTPAAPLAPAQQETDNLAPEADAAALPAEELEDLKPTESALDAVAAQELSKPSPSGVLSKMVAGTVAPLAEQIGETTTASAVQAQAALEESNTGLRRRLNAAAAASEGTDYSGKIRLSLFYHQDKGVLTVTVHGASGLPGSDLPDLPGMAPNQEYDIYLQPLYVYYPVLDPYVKLYLLPDRNKKSKRKTEVVKDSTEPVFEEAFEYKISPPKIGGNQLEISVVDRKGIFARSPLMGRVIIDLDDPDLVRGSGVDRWFDLHNDDSDSE